jgi:hypothetical protein
MLRSTLYEELKSRKRGNWWAIKPNFASKPLHRSSAKVVVSDNETVRYQIIRLGATIVMKPKGFLKGKNAPAHKSGTYFHFVGRWHGEKSFILSFKSNI